MDPLRGGVVRPATVRETQTRDTPVRAHALLIVQGSDQASAVARGHASPLPGRTDPHEGTQREPANLESRQGGGIGADSARGSPSGSLGI